MQQLAHPHGILTPAFAINHVLFSVYDHSLRRGGDFVTTHKGTRRSSVIERARGHLLSSTKRGSNELFCNEVCFYVIIAFVALFALTVLSGQTAAHVGRHAHVVGGAVYEHSSCQSFAQSLRNRSTALFMKFWKPFILKLRKLLILWLTLFRSSLVHFHY